MTIKDLLNKYATNDEIEYLKKDLGSIEYVDDIVSSTMGLKHLMKNRNLYYRFYEIFHNIYTNIEYEKQVDNTILNCLTILESYYIVYSKEKLELEKKKNISKKYNNKQLEIKMNNDILNMYNINTLPTNYKYYTLAKKINDDIKDFSLDEIFNTDAVFDEKKGLNAVSIITPHQTISRFNETKFNNMKGSGYHDDNFEEILKAVYGKRFDNNASGQDIEIRYTTLNKPDGTLAFTILPEIPLVINSSQMISLQNLNNEIKRLEDALNQKIYVLPCLKDYETRINLGNYTDQTNLDNVLNDVIVNDNINYKYQELCFVGYSNLENQFKKVQHTR